MTTPLARPKRKNPLKKTRLPLAPQGARSRAAHGLTAAAAEGRFALQVCAECAAIIYPARDACPNCLSSRLSYREVDPRGTLVVETTVRTSTDPYFREHTPWRVGTVKLDVGPMIVAHLHGDAVDVLFEPEHGFREFSEPRIATQHTHGTGCTYSAAITAELAKGSALRDAIDKAKKFITEAIRTAPGLGSGTGPLNHHA